MSDRDLLRIDDLHARPAPEEGAEAGPDILNGLDLVVRAGEVATL